MSRQGWRLRSGNLGQRSLLLTLVPLVLAATTVGIILSTLAQTRQADDEVQRGLRALGQIHAVHAALAEAASGVRGFIITQDETFLRPYERAEQQLREALRGLEANVQDPVQRQQLTEISDLVDVKLSNLAILTARSRELSGENMLAYSRDNKELLDRLRRRIAFMEERENQVIAQLQQQQRRTRQIGHVAILMTVLATFVLASILAQSFASGLIRRIRHLRDNARRISSREPLMRFASQASDELAELDRLLVQTGNTLYDKLDELEAARETAEQASQAKTRFLSRTSHELRTPLSAVMGFSALLEKHIEQPALRRQVEAIQSSAEHLLRLVNDLLDMSSIEAGQLTLKEDTVCLAEQVGRAFEIVQGRAAARHIRLSNEGCAKLPAVMADAGRVLQVLINLLDNAVKFAPQGSSIVLIGECKGDGRVRLHVIDQGPGIPGHFHSELFRPFSRQDGQQEGVGLGLAISYGLMQTMGGALTFAPTVQQGSCFTLHFHSSREEEAPAESLPARPQVAMPAQGGDAPWLLVLCSEDDSFAMQIEATAQRLGLPSFRVKPGQSLPSAVAASRWLLILDAFAAAEFVFPDTAPPAYCLWRGAANAPAPAITNNRVLPYEVPVSAWRNALQEILDEDADPRNT